MDGPRFYPLSLSMIQSATTREKTALLILLGLCIASRLLTGVWYIEDPDSLRFALGAIDYDIVRLQPHFPGYPVFMGAVRIFTLLGGSFGLAFALVGGLSIFAMIVGALRFCNTRLDRPEGVLLAGLFFFNPMLWVMSNRYMPDLMGGAIVLWILYLTIRDDHASRLRLYWGIALTGLLAGVRLSYLPFVLLPLLIALFRTRREPTAIGVFILGILLWLTPMVLDTGWDELIAAAGKQTAGHFQDFGGTVTSVPDMEERRLAVLKGVVADGFGGYWEHRGTIAVIITIGLLLLLGRGAWWMFGRETDGLVITILSASIYIAWILLYQNVVYQTRHVLPLIPVVLTLAWAGAAQLMRSGWSGRVVVSLFLTIYGLTGIVIALQHTSPTAIARVADHLRNENREHRVLLSSPLINFYLQSTGVKGTYIDADQTHPERKISSHQNLTVIGWYGSLIERAPLKTITFHHNPYVNPIWPEIPVSEYGPEE